MSVEAEPSVDVPQDDSGDLPDNNSPSGVVVNGVSGGIDQLPVPENVYPQLRTLVALALDQSPRMRAQRALDDIAEGSRIVARAGLLPNLSGSIGSQPIRSETRLKTRSASSGGGQYWDNSMASKFGYGVGISQPLFRWGVLRNNAKIGKINVDISKEKTAEEFRRLVLDIRVAYMNLIINKMSVDRMAFARQLAERDLASTEVRFQAQAASRGQVLQQKYRVEASVLAEDRAREDYRRVRLKLLRLCGLDTLEDDGIPMMVAPVSVSIPTLQSLAQKYLADVPGQSSNLRIIKNQIEIEKLNYRNIKARLRPRLDSSAGISRDEQNYDSTAYAPYGVISAYIGLNVTWSIFDGFATKGLKISSLARKRDLERTYAQTIVELSDATMDRLKQAEFATRSMTIRERQLTAVTRAQTRFADKIEKGTASKKDEDDAKLRLLDAQLAAASSRADCLVKTMRFLSGIFEDPALADLDRATP